MLPARTITCVLVVAALVALASAAHAATGLGTKLHPVLIQRLEQEPQPAKAWVFFTDKGISSPQELAAALQKVERTYNPRAVERRRLRGQNARRGGALFDQRDLPVVTSYVDAVAATGARVHIVSRWLNAVSAYVTRQQAEQIAALPFVDRLESVGRSRGVRPVPAAQVQPQASGLGATAYRVDYGQSGPQLQQINLPALHNEGYTGQGIIVGILDTGFLRTHTAFNQPGHVLNVIAEYDFVDNDGNTAPEPGDPSGQHSHGTMILGCIGAYKPGSLVGGAFDAAFVLCKTEDTTAEYPAEEDNFVAGLEFTEAHGADITTASLGYIDWYTQAQLNGQTAVTSIACNIHTANGVHHTNAAGNEYHDNNPATSHLIAPADAFQVITCGAVNSSGSIASFSSDGPSADGRVKPEVLARGVSTYTIDPYSNNNYTTASGTSLSTPLVACAVACLVQARPYWSVDQMRQHLFHTADYYVAYGTFDPLYVRGYGIVNAHAAAHHCPNAGTVVLDRATYACESLVTVAVADCGLDTNHNVIEQITLPIDSTSETGVEHIILTETAPDSAEFIGTKSISQTDAPGVLWVSDGDTVTVTYIDADDGNGHYNVVVTATALVDCMPPSISNVKTTKLSSTTAAVSCTASEPVRVVMPYGLSCGSLSQQASSAGYSASPTVALSGLTSDKRYYYAVQAEDAAGNTTYVDNGGWCFTFHTLAGPQVAYSYPLDSNPGWLISGGQWAFGHPTGQGGTQHGYPDPSNGYTGSNVYGVNLNGDYSTTVGGPYYVRLGPIDLTGRTEVSLGFMRWLNTDYQPYVYATIDVSKDGSNWTEVFNNGTTEIAESAWSSRQYDISAVADGQATVYVRWGYKIGSGAWAYSGWNIDDITIWACVPPSWVLGDLNCDQKVDFDDISPFVLALSGEGPYYLELPDCNWLNADCNEDGQVDLNDINPFVALLMQ